MAKKRINKLEFVDKISNYVMKNLKENNPKSLSRLEQYNRLTLSNHQSKLDREVDNLGFISKHNKHS